MELQNSQCGTKISDLPLVMTYFEYYLMQVYSIITYRHFVAISIFCLALNIHVVLFTFNFWDDRKEF